MGENSKIGWTRHTFNPWWGCQRVSPGCLNCYAAELDDRFNSGRHWGPDAPRKQMKDAYWRAPYRWNKEAAAAGERHRVFTASMADVFEDRADLVETRKKLFGLIHQTPNLDWLLLTKRPANMRRLGADLEIDCGGRWPSNVWAGTTVESQAYQHRVYDLQEIDAAVRFVSVEPMLGPVKFVTLNKIDWVIIGGESGRNARPFHVEAARALVQDIRAEWSKTKIFVKQMGDNPVNKNHQSLLPIISSKAGTDIDDLPTDLQIREYPQ